MSGRKGRCMGNIGKSVMVAALFFFVLALFPDNAAAQTIFANPHGPYDAQTSGCAACHVAHSGLAPRLLSRSEITVLCLSCHDGSASIYNVASIYDGNSGNTSFHPVISTGNPSVGEILECSDCHNPHAQNPRLLRSSDGTNSFTAGPAFCLACHGSTARVFPRDTGDGYWVRTLGNYNNANSPAHYDVTRATMRPASGTNVTCVKCHSPHGGEKSALLNETEEDLCYSCHMLNVSGSWEAHPITAFTRTGSVHNVDRAGVSQLGCTSCHGPHTVNSARVGGADGVSMTCYRCHVEGDFSQKTEYNIQSTQTVISDPGNTKRLFAGKAGTGLGGLAHTVGDLSDFCLRCHTGTPPQATRSTEEFVPYTVVFPATNITTNSGGWNKAGYKDTSHGKANPKITCGNCHESHGSDFAALARFGEDTTTNNRMCLRCHNESTVTQKNIRADLVKTYRHPTLTVENKHSNKENYQNMPLADRHAECADCHDPHQATAARGTPPAAGGAITGVSGVKINYGSATWSNWPGNATFSFVSKVDYEYELCFKCHSYYSYGNNPPNSVSRAQNGRRGGKQMDVAKEFNPNNPAYHAVVGSTKNATYVSSGTRAYGWLNQNWARRREWQNDNGTVAATRGSARLYCVDCHGSDNRNVFGPHGSVNPFILIAPWNPNTGGTSAKGYGGTGGQNSGNTSHHLCFVCHDYSFYSGYTGSSYNVDTGSSTRRSAFSRGSNYNYHSTKKHERVGCASCHGAVPHGGQKRSMLTEHRDPLPYADYSWLQINTFDSAGNWQKGSCQHGNLAGGGNPNSGSSCD